MVDQSDHSSSVQCPRHLSAALTLWLQQGMRYHEWSSACGTLGKTSKRRITLCAVAMMFWLVCACMLNWSCIHAWISVGELSDFTMQRGSNFKLFEERSSIVKWAEGKSHRAIFQSRAQTLLEEVICSDMSLAAAGSIRHISMLTCTATKREFFPVWHSSSTESIYFKSCTFLSTISHSKLEFSFW